MKDITKLRKLYKLKEVYRHNSVQNRKESSAEHTWSALMLADYLLTRTKLKLDRLKVYELLMYHDIVEIETGDVPIHHEEKRNNKKHEEMKAAIKLAKELPEEIGKKLLTLFTEFEENKTMEAKFAHAIDKLDALIHELDYKKDWQGWTEVMVHKYHGEALKEFPKLHALFLELIGMVKKEKYFDEM